MVTDETGDGCKGSEEDPLPDLARAWVDGSPVWFPRSTHLVGVFVGYHGACHLLCWLRNSYGLLCLLRTYQTGIPNILLSNMCASV